MSIPDNILSGCLSNDPKMQKALVNYMAPKLMTTCRRYLNSDEDRKDVIQESFIKIFRYLKKQDDAKGSFEAWAHRICINECLIHLKKQKSISNIHSNLELSHSTDPVIWSNFGIEELVRQIEKLPIQYRTIFNLIEIDGYTHEEVANLLNISLPTSRSNLSRARSKLRSMLTPKNCSYYGL